ncbi:MAG: hypothetical protein AAGI71_16600 [Bacteroidota bacterium]
MRRLRRLSLRLALLTGVALIVLAAHPAASWAQETIPPEFRGEEEQVARGILDGNLIQTNFRNHGEFSRWMDIPWGVWPRGIGGRHIDGIGIVVAGRVPGERAKWPSFGGQADTLVNPVIINYREAGKRLGPNGSVWGWQPLRGFHNTNRINRLGELEPTPALSDDPSSWPNFWPDRLDNPDDPGWSGQWNGFFGRGVFNADLESFYVMDDFTDIEYHIDPTTNQPFSPFGVFYPNPSDSTMGGLGLRNRVRIFQWANVLAEDLMFILYRVTNNSPTPYTFNIDGDQGLFFAQVMDYGLGNEEGDENAAFNAQEDIVFGWDQDGVGQRTTGELYDLGYTGFAFLESPARGEDGLDNDEDGIVDEQRFGGAGMLIQGRDAIRSFVEGTYNIADFERVYGPLEELPAFQAGRWWTGDENLDWESFSDDNNNGVLDEGELVNNDVGLDGLGPFDLGYPGPDRGEGDGIPTLGEPNFDELDIDESDQIGLTGFDLNSRPFYESGDNLRDDTWMFDRLLNEAQFPLGTPADEEEADIEPFLIFVSGPVALDPGDTDFFSTAWIFGEDETDFFKNRRTAQNIYDADYNFAQPPVTPNLTAVAGDGRVVLSWDTTAIASFDRFSQQFDFEGFRLYKGTDALLSDARLISNVDGVPTFYRPLEQWDLDNGIRGPVPVLDGESVYDLGDDTGLAFFYIDDDVINGKTYYYALVAYDHGVLDDQGRVQFNPTTGLPELDPQENVFNISTDLAGNIVGLSSNAAVVTPRSKPAGLVEGSANEDLTRVTSGLGTGSINVRIVGDDLVKRDTVYQVRFFDAPADSLPGTGMYETVAYEVFNVSSNEPALARTSLTGVSPLIDGFVVEFDNYEFISGEIEYDETQLGYVANAGSANELYDLDPRQLEGYTTNWVAQIQPDTTGSYGPAPFTYQLRWVAEEDSTYRMPRFGVRFLRGNIPIFAVNTTTNELADILIEDRNGNREFDVDDDLIINDVDETGQRRFRHRVRFSVPDGASSAPPQAGDVLQVGVRRPFATGDFFQFTLSPGAVDTDLAQNELEDVAVVPNPYIGASAYEQRSQVEGRGTRLVRFINLPQQCTIRIYTIRGELIRTLEHNSIGGDTFWDLQTSGGQDVAYGIYIYHVEAPGVGEHVGKLALVK